MYQAFFAALQQPPSLAYSKAIMKIPGIETALSGRNSMVGTLFRIVSGSTGNLQTGESFQIRLPDIIEPKTTLTLKGQTIAIEGLSKGMEGKTISVKLILQASTPFLELLAPGRSSAESKAIDPTQPALMKTGKMVISARQPFHATPAAALTQTSRKAAPLTRRAILISPLSHIPAKQINTDGKFEAVVMQTSGKTALLSVVPNLNPPATQPGHIATKTAHAIAHAKDHQTLIASQKEAPRQLKIANLSAPMKLGEHLQVELKESGRKTEPELLFRVMREHPVVAATAPKESGKTNQASLLQKGWGVARVEQRLSGGNISFNWQGKSFESKAPATISAGDTLLIKTNTAGKRSFLEVVDVARALPEKAINLFKTRIAQSEPLKQALLTLLQSRNAPVPPAEGPLPASLSSQLVALGTLLNHYTITPDKPLDGPRLGEMIHNSGHLYEALLSKELLSSEKPLHQIQQRDLKAMLLKLIEVSQASEATPGTIQVAQSSERGAARIESQQAISLLALHQPEPLRIEFPLIVQGIITTVQMSISTDQEATRHELTEDAASDESFTILFALDLSGLGNVDIDAHITSDSVHATIYPENEKARHFVQKHISRLSDRLDALGFNHLHLATSVKSRMSEKKQHAFECLNLGLPISKGVLDVTG